MRHSLVPIPSRSSFIDVGYYHDYEGQDTMSSDYRIFWTTFRTGTLLWSPSFGSNLTLDMQRSVLTIRSGHRSDEAVFFVLEGGLPKPEQP